MRRVHHDWEEPGFVARAHRWIDDRLAGLGLSRTGPVEQPHVYDWSTVMRVPTSGGTVWFKANAEPLAFEAALVARLARRAPGRVPAPLAADPTTGWMLLSDAGRRLREVVAEERSLHRWIDVLDGCARLQLACERDVDDLLDLGVPDRRLQTLPDAYAALLAELGEVDPRLPAPEHVAELSGQLAAHGIRETVQHDDLHDGNVFLRNGDYLVFDWGDSCVSHPFHTLAVTLRATAWRFELEAGDPRIERMRDAYLEPFGSYGSRAELLEAFAIAYRLGTIARALSWHRAVQAFPEIEPDQSDSVPYGLKLFLKNGPIGTWR
jgi:hypothetical protein